MKVSAFKVGMGAPDDVSEARKLLDAGAFQAQHVVAVLGKTEGNGGVNDYTRALATQCFQLLIAEKSGLTMNDIAKKVPIIWSGGTEGLMSPHATIFVKEPGGADAGNGEKGFTVGTAYTRDMAPEEFGTMPHVLSAAEGVKAAIQDAGIDDPSDIHFRADQDRRPDHRTDQGRLLAESQRGHHRYLQVHVLRPERSRLGHRHGNRRDQRRGRE